MKEARQLNKLLQAASRQMEYDAKNEELSTFRITIGGSICRFVLGGPQLDGLLAFAYHIAEENGYIVDHASMTVKDSYLSDDEVCLKAVEYALAQVATSDIDVLDGDHDYNVRRLKSVLETLHSKVETEE